MQWRCESRSEKNASEWKEIGFLQALDGRNGEVLWSYEKSNHEVFALNCQRDIDGDNIPDCLTGGRGGVSFHACDT